MENSIGLKGLENSIGLKGLNITAYQSMALTRPFDDQEIVYQICGDINSFGFREIKLVRVQRSGVDTIKYHT